MSIDNKKNREHAWDRVYTAVRASGMTVNAFARYIGLARGENLYQIKRGNNGVSLDVAERIQAKFPRFSILWLMTGSGDPDSQEADCCTLPCYVDIWDASFPNGPASSRLTLSRSAACGAEVAVRCGEESPGGLMRNPILLLRRYAQDEEPLYGNLHLVVTDRLRVVRMLWRGQEADGLRLTVGVGPGRATCGCAGIRSWGCGSRWRP